MWLWEYKCYSAVNLASKIIAYLMHFKVWSCLLLVILFYITPEKKTFKELYGYNKSLFNSMIGDQP